MIVPMVEGTNLPDYLQNGIGRGNENVGIDDLIIPRLGLIQALSPERLKKKPEYIEGADEGLMFNNVTRQLYGDTIHFVPVYYKMEYLIFKNRESGGGFRGAFSTKVEAQSALDALEDSEECSITDTGQHFCLIIIDNQIVQEIVISMSSSKLRVSRKLNSLVRIGAGDRFSRVYELKSHEESSEKGDYYNYDVRPIGFPSVDVYKTALKLYSDISEGSKGIDRNYVAETNEDDLPF